MKISELINGPYKDYAHYVVESRAIPRLSDGLKPVQRRALWSAKKVAKDLCKVTKLAGATLSLHPHGSVSIEDCISGMTQDFAGANNICYFEGKGQFGERINGPGKGYAAARYVSVRLSESFKQFFGVDSELIPMIPNYDETTQEPKTFLPIIPSVLLNPTQGIAVGFACNILPRKLEDIRRLQVAHLSGKDITKKALTPYYEGFKGEIKKGEKRGEWICKGVWEKRGKIIEITELPIGVNRESYVSLLDKLEEKDVITSYEDNCKGDFSFKVRLKDDLSDDDIENKFKLSQSIHENITLIGFNDEVIERGRVGELIAKFTDWRFKFYLKRFKLLLDQTDDELEFKKALLLVIEKGLFKKFPQLKKGEIRDLLRGESIKDPHITKILQIPIYRFGKDEVEGLKDEIKKLEDMKKEYEVLVNDEGSRKDFYIKELKKV